ncbi:MAG: hypothetical protein HY719_12155, partial [Planctomycetes bacterium]|nr:hypothetical protein [Planctomycetota bacterium]
DQITQLPAAAYYNATNGDLMFAQMTEDGKYDVEIVDDGAPVTPAKRADKGERRARLTRNKAVSTEEMMNNKRQDAGRWCSLAFFPYRWWQGREAEGWETEREDFIVWLPAVAYAVVVQETDDNGDPLKDEAGKPVRHKELRLARREFDTKEMKVTSGWYITVVDDGKHGKDCKDGKHGKDCRNFGDPAGSDWVGDYASLAFNPVEDTERDNAESVQKSTRGESWWISYYDETNKVLRVAHQTKRHEDAAKAADDPFRKVPNGMGPGEEWTVEVADDGLGELADLAGTKVPKVSVGTHCSIAFVRWEWQEEKEGGEKKVHPEWTPAVAYHRAGDGDGALFYVARYDDVTLDVRRLSQGSAPYALWAVIRGPQQADYFRDRLEKPKEPKTFLFKPGWSAFFQRALDLDEKGSWTTFGSPTRPVEAEELKKLGDMLASPWVRVDDSDRDRGQGYATVLRCGKDMRPAIAYQVHAKQMGVRVKYAVAPDVHGLRWTSAYVDEEGRSQGAAVSMQYLDDVPCLAYHDENEPKSMRFAVHFKGTKEWRARESNPGPLDFRQVVKSHVKTRNENGPGEFCALASAFRAGKMTPVIFYTDPPAGSATDMDSVDKNSDLYAVEAADWRGADKKDPTSWRPETLVDNGGTADVGRYNQMVWHKGVLHAVYYDATFGDLMYAQYRDNKWLTAPDPKTPYLGVVDSGARDLKDKDQNHAGGEERITNLRDVGRYASLAVKTDGTPIVAYYDASNDDLRIATVEQPKGGAAVWKQSIVAEDGGRYCSLALDSSDGGEEMPAVAYVNNAQRLVYTRWDGKEWRRIDVAGPLALRPLKSGKDAAQWPYGVVEGDAGAVRLAFYGNLAAKRPRKARIVFQDGNALKYVASDGNSFGKEEEAQRLAGRANFLFANVTVDEQDWTAVVAGDDSGAIWFAERSPSGKWTAKQLGVVKDAQMPAAAWSSSQHSRAGTTIVHVAFYNSRYGSLYWMRELWDRGLANVGANPRWEPSLMDPGSQDTRLGLYPAVAVDDQDNPRIIYYDYTHRNLKYVKPR